MIFSFHAISADEEVYYNPTDEDELERLIKHYTRQRGYTVVQDFDTRALDRLQDMRIVTLSKTIKKITA